MSRWHGDNSRYCNMAEERRKVIRLDLFNFDSPENQSSRYILTSPRSLKACSRLGIKPVELLPQTLEEFSVSSSGLGLLQGTLTTVYNESERLRRKKLQAARREREKVIAEEWGEGEGRTSEKDGMKSWTREARNAEVAERKRCNGVPSKLHLPDKDQRILEAMTSRMEEEERLTVLRDEAERVWRLEREQEIREREEKEAAHKKRVAESQRMFKQQVDSLKKVHRSLMEEEGREKQLQLQTKLGRWSEAAQVQAKLRAQKIEERRHQDLVKKSLQEQRLRQLAEDESLQQQNVKEHLNSLENRAAANRETIIERETKELQVRHKAERVRHEKRRQEIAAQSQEEQALLQSSVTERHRRAVERYRAQKEMRESQIRQASDEEARRLAECKLRSEKMENELVQWREEVDTYKKQCMIKAGETAQELMEERRKEIQAKRMKREREHQENIRQKKQEELERRAQYAAEAEMKRARSAAVLRERELTLQKSREVAVESAKLRDQVKDQYLRNSFNRMALKAEMQAALEKRQPKTLASSQNKSKLILA